VNHLGNLPRQCPSINPPPQFSGKRAPIRPAPAKLGKVAVAQRLTEGAAGAAGGSRNVPSLSFRTERSEDPE